MGQISMKVAGKTTILVDADVAKCRMMQHDVATLETLLRSLLGQTWEVSDLQLMP